MNFISRCFKRCYRTSVYRIKLDNDKYYVGRTNDKNKRIYSHIKGHGSAWTRKHKFIDCMSTITYSDSPFWELEETLENMYVYGIDNVRGSMFTRMNLSRFDKIQAAQLYCEMYNLCRKCGSPDHYISNCKAEEGEVVPWVIKFGGELDMNVKRCVICLKNINDKPNYYKYCDECYTIQN